MNGVEWFIVPSYDDRSVNRQPGQPNVPTRYDSHQSGQHICIARVHVHFARQDCLLRRLTNRQDTQLAVGGTLS